MFFIIKKSEETTLSFYKILSISYKNGNANDCKFKICNKKWYVINNETKGAYSHQDPEIF